MSSAPSQTIGTDVRIAGTCYVVFAFDVGFHIDLGVARERLQRGESHKVMRARRRAPEWFEYEPPPLRIVLDAPAPGVPGHPGSPGIELIVYDFGAIALTYRLPFDGSPVALSALGVAVNDDEALESAARSQAREIVEFMGDAVARPRLREGVEDFSIFAVTNWSNGHSPAGLLEQCAPEFAGAIEGESGPLSVEQVERTLAARLSYSPDDLVVVDWNAALLFDRSPEDIVTLLQHANVELLELRVLDEELDALLDGADQALAQVAGRRFWPAFESGRLLRRFAMHQTDAAASFEGVNNAIKLLGNQYLARVYRTAAARLDLPSWQASVQRKLVAGESVYQKLASIAGAKRMETLELIIVILIAVSIIMPFIPLAGAH